MSTKIQKQLDLLMFNRIMLNFNHSNKLKFNFYPFKMQKRNVKEESVSPLLISIINTCISNKYNNM